jgi:hypothetical protein
VTTTTGQAPTARADEPDLSGFLMAHRGFRAEFARLAAAARQVRDGAHAALIEDQIELVLHLLHHHHTAEDTTVWPELLRLAPEAAPALARLEAQHEEMDPLFVAVADRARPVAERADDLQRLNDLLNAHLDEEEHEAVPLIRAHISRSWWNKDGKAVTKSLDRKRLPVIFGWLGSVSTPAQRAGALATVPWLPRTLYRMIWGPAYRKRFTALYGESPAVPVPT